MPLLAKDLGMLKRLAARGDVYARGILYALEGEAASGVDTVVTLTTPAAKSATAVHANVFGDAAPVGPDTKVRVATALTNPVVARNLSATFGANWDGGDVTIDGTDQFGVAQSETLTANAGNVVYGAKVFKTVTRVSYNGSGVGTHATNVVSIGTGDKLGTTKKLANSQLTVRIAGVVDASTVDVTNSAFTPSAGNIADGSKSYEVTIKVAA